MNKIQQLLSTRRNRTIAVITAVILAGMIIVNVNHQEEKVTYDKIKPEKGDIIVTVLSTGLVDPQNRLEIKPPIAGRIEEVAVKEGEIVKKGQLLAWMSSTERAALLDSAHARGEKEVEEWKKLYKATPILAPINGTIILRNTEPGQTLSSQDAILVMSDRLTVKAQVDETDIAKIQTGQQADIVLDAYAQNTIKGHVDKIAYDAKTVNNVTTYIVDVLPETIPDFMRSGMTANVIFYIESRKDILTVPVEAVKEEDGNFYVLISGSIGIKPVKKIIQTGASDNKKTEILSGLTPEDSILVPQISQEKGSKGVNPFMPSRNRQR